MTKNYHAGVANISFYLTDEDGNIKEDKNGNEIDSSRIRIYDSHDHNLSIRLWKQYGLSIRCHAD